MLDCSIGKNIFAADYRVPEWMTESGTIMASRVRRITCVAAVAPRRGQAASLPGICR
jgi:hypothetical protein